MAYFALMTREQFGKSRKFLRNPIKFSENQEEFLCRLRRGQEIEDCTTLTTSEMEEHIRTSPNWGGKKEEADIDFSSMTKAELIELANEREVELPAKATKAKIINALKGN